MFKHFSYAPGQDKDGMDLVTVLIYFFNISSFYVEKRGEFFFLETKLMGLKIDINTIILWSSESKESSAFNEHCFISIKSL